FSPDFAYRISGSFADKYRVEQIRALLNRNSKLTVSYMLAVQKDVYSAYDYFLAQQVLAGFVKRGSNDALTRDAVPILRRWNGQMDKDEAAPIMTQLLHTQIGTVLVASLLQPAMNKALSAKLESQPQNTQIKAGQPGRTAITGSSPSV